MKLSLFMGLSCILASIGSVILGIHDLPFLSIAIPVFFIGLQLFYIKKENLSFYIQDYLIVIFTLPLGFFLETYMINIRLINYINHKIIPPVWIVFLYPLSSILLNHLLKKIKNNYLKPYLIGLIGFIGGPLCYLIIMILGGLNFPNNFISTLFILGSYQTLFLCILIKITALIEEATKKTLDNRDSKLILILLYDGACPLCKREISLLQKKANRSNIKFIDISSKDFSPAQYNNIEYSKAMSQIHAIDGNGNTLVGIPVFAAVYARCNLLLTSTLLNIPFIKAFLTPLYRLFAKKRLWITRRITSNINKGNRN